MITASVMKALREMQHILGNATKHPVSVLNNFLSNVKKISLEYTSVFQETYLGPCQTSTMELFAKIADT